MIPGPDDDDGDDDGKWLNFKEQLRMIRDIRRCCEHSYSWSDPRTDEVDSKMKAKEQLKEQLIS